MAYEGVAETKQIGRRLGALRRAAGLKVSEASQRTGLSVSAIKSHEKGVRGHRLSVLAKYARAYGVSQSAIVEANEAAPGAAHATSEDRVGPFINRIAALERALINSNICLELLIPIIRFDALRPGMADAIHEQVVRNRSDLANTTPNTSKAPGQR